MCSLSGYFSAPISDSESARKNDLYSTAQFGGATCSGDKKAIPPRVIP
jgi:hypothetical protein